MHFGILTRKLDEECDAILRILKRLNLIAFRERLEWFRNGLENETRVKNPPKTRKISFSRLFFD